MTTIIRIEEIALNWDEWKQRIEKGEVKISREGLGDLQEVYFPTVTIRTDQMSFGQDVHPALQFTIEHVEHEEAPIVSPDGCPYKRDPNHSCRGSWVGSGMAATSICNHLATERFPNPWRDCSNYYRQADLHDLKERTDLTDFCCGEMESLFHQCVEESGYMAGGFDLRIYPNDGKDVWRNYARTRFRFCPFCGFKLGKPFVKEEGQS